MKKIIASLCSLLLFFSSYAQPYKQCLDEGMVRWSLLDFHVADAGWRTTDVVAYGDTLINSHIYKKMYLFNDPLWGEEVSEDNEIWKNLQPDLIIYEQMTTYIRESEDASQMYVYDANIEKEYLISDMNLQKGDVLAYPCTHVGGPNGFEYGFRNFTVDSVYIKNGLKHIRLDTGYFPILYTVVTFIEGIGPDIWYIYPYEQKGELNCFQNQSVFYKNEETDRGGICPCGYYWMSPDGLKEIVTDDFTLIVEREQIKILLSKNETVRISLYDLSGGLRESRQFFSGECVIKTEGFPAGMYILKVMYPDKNEMIIRKIMISI